MRAPRLVRRRELWIPTIWGWALLAGLAAAAGWLGLHALYGFLAPDEPVNRGVLVVEGWVNDAGLAEAARLWRTGAYARLVTTGGPIERYSALFPFANYAEQGADSLVKQGIPAAEIAIVAAPSSNRERTFASAVALRDWLERNRIDAPAFDVLSEGPHARRTWYLYRKAFGANATIGIRSASPDVYPPATWWQSSAGAKDVLTEAIAWVWVKCFFHPIPSSSHGESNRDGGRGCRFWGGLCAASPVVASGDPSRGSRVTPNSDGNCARASERPACRHLSGGRKLRSASGVSRPSFGQPQFV